MKSLSSFIAVVAFMSPAAVVASDHCAADLNGDGVVGPTDLAMLLVSWGQCQVSCEDGAQNQDETDIDCGGSTCPPCADGAGCVSHGDCSSTVCLDGVCQDAPSCDEYCAVVGASCMDANEQYSSTETCLDYCNDWAQLPSGTFFDFIGNTVGCRLYHAGLPAQANPLLHCPHAGPSGGDFCGSWCENYCYLAMLNCTDVNQLYDDLGECMDTCASFPNDGTANDTSGDTVQCRIYHLGLAGSSESAGDVHCPHGSPGGGSVCVDP